jgi:hypothetical protein
MSDTNIYLTNTQAARILDATTGGRSVILVSGGSTGDVLTLQADGTYLPETLAAGPAGADGEDGASAYEIAVANGFVGDETAWLASLVGADGQDGADGADGADGQDGAPGATGATGPQGPQGDPGVDGADGADGAGVAAGGTSGQVLAKSSGDDYDTGWITPFSGSYDDLSDKPTIPAVAKIYEKVALSPNGASIAAGAGKGFAPVSHAGTITAFSVQCDPNNEPTVTVEVDLNKVNTSDGTVTSALSSVASITSGNNSGTGTINGTQTVSVGDWLQVDIDQGSDGQDLIGIIEITPS